MSSRTSDILATDGVPSSSLRQKVDIEQAELSLDVENDAAATVVSSSPGNDPTTLDELKGAPLLVDWEGDDDPQNPLNWSGHAKWSAMLTVSAMCFLSPLASTLVAPVAPAIAEEFGVTDASVVALMVSIFVLGYAIGPLLASPLSELYG